MTILVIYFAIWLEKCLSMIHPVVAIFVDDRDEHLIIVGTVELGHNGLYVKFIAHQYITTRLYYLCSFQILWFIVKKTVRVSIPDQRINFQIMSDTLQILLNRTAHWLLLKFFKLPILCCLLPGCLTCNHIVIKLNRILISCTFFMPFSYNVSCNMRTNVWIILHKSSLTEISLPL